MVVPLLLRSGGFMALRAHASRRRLVSIARTYQVVQCPPPPPPPPPTHATDSPCPPHFTACNGSHNSTTDSSGAIEKGKNCRGARVHPLCYAAGCGGGGGRMGTPGVLRVNMLMTSLMQLDSYKSTCRTSSLGDPSSMTCNSRGRRLFCENGASQQQRGPSQGAALP